MLPDKRKDPIRISLRQMIDNPTGKGSAYVASRKMIRQGMNLSFINLLHQFRRVFFAVPYVYKGTGDILWEVKVPSEGYKYNHLIYTVLFYMEYDKSKRYSQRNIRVFTNCPSFLFTYCYVMYHDDLLIDECAYKVAKAITQKPSIRNPVESLGYEKSTYIAARYLVDGFCLTDGYINRFGKEANAATINELALNVADPDKIVELYQIGERLHAKNHKKELSMKEKNLAKQQQKAFIQHEKENSPKRSGFIIKLAPRSKITAKKEIKKMYPTEKKAALFSTITKRRR